MKKKAYVNTSTIYTDSSVEPLTRVTEKWDVKGIRLYLYASPEFKIKRFLFSSEVAMSYGILNYTSTSTVYYPESNDDNWENKEETLNGFSRPIFRCGVGYQFRLIDVYALFGGEHYLNLKLRWKVKSK